VTRALRMLLDEDIRGKMERISRTYLKVTEYIS
jgi:hypothetical protein